MSLAKARYGKTITDPKYPTTATHVAVANLGRRGRVETRIQTTPEEAEARGWELLGTIEEVRAGELTPRHKARPAPKTRKPKAGAKPARSKAKS